MKLPLSYNLPVEILARCFNDTTNSYKFYWFLAILEELTENNSNVLSMDNIVIRMVSLVWYPLDFYKLSFGKQDKFKEIAQFVSSRFEVNNNPKSKDLFTQINENFEQPDRLLLTKKVNSLLRYVPYRFLRPFFNNELKGYDDNVVNKEIIRLSEFYFNEKSIFYQFKKNKIEIHSEWKIYFIKHISILKSFIYWELTKFLQKNNPNVIGLSEKLFKPQVRDFKIPKLFWSKYISIKKSIKCIYSDVVFSKNYSIDHFVPWSYIVHDKLWNLVPTIQKVNSSKSNDLPNIDKYLNAFCNIQYDAFQTIYKSNFKDKYKILEDYSIFFNMELERIAEISKNKFQQKIADAIVPKVQIAENLGFNSDWVYLL